MKYLECNVLNFKNSVAIPKYEVECANLDVSSHLDVVSRDLVLEVNASVLSYKTKTDTTTPVETSRREEEGEYYTHSTWWDHLKDTFQRWVMSRGGKWSTWSFLTPKWDKHTYVCSTRFCEQHTHNHYRLCPHIKVDPNKTHVEFLINGVDSSIGKVGERWATPRY